MEPLVSIILPIHDEPESNVQLTVESLLASTTRGSIPFEIILVDDGSATPVRGNRSVRVLRTPWNGAAAARNHGARHGRGAFLVFLDAHCTVPSNWLTSLLGVRAALRAALVSPAIADLHDQSAAGYGLTLTSWRLDVDWLPKAKNRPYEIPIAPGACILAVRKLFSELGGFDEGLRPWGLEDVELSLRAWLSGHRVGLDPSTTIRHLFRKNLPYAMTCDQMTQNTIRVAESHFSDTNLKKVLVALGIDFVRALRDRPHALKYRHVRKDAWFFRKFPLAV